MLNYVQFDQNSYFVYFQHESLDSYRLYIHAVLGFFILEDHVLNTGNGLITRAFLDDMWTMALSKIVTALQTHSVSQKQIIPTPQHIFWIIYHSTMYF